MLLLLLTCQCLPRGGGSRAVGDHRPQRLVVQVREPCDELVCGAPAEQVQQGCAATVRISLASFNGAARRSRSASVTGFLSGGAALPSAVRSRNAMAAALPLVAAFASSS